MTSATSTARTNRFDDLSRLMSLMTGDEKHDFAATSTLDVTWVLYERVLRVDPERPDWPERDRFILSKGHGPMAYYAVLCARGFFPEDWLPTFGSYGSPLGYHPDHTLIPGVEVSSGSLGHGLPLAAGRALALGIQGNGLSRVFCLVGDAELDEGSNHEALAFAGRNPELARLTAVVIDNRSSSLGWPGGIAARFAVEGWTTATCNGRDHDAIEAALLTAHPESPLVVVATVEAKS